MSPLSLMATTYLTWGWLSVSIPNLVVIGLLVLVFVLALVLPFPKAHPIQEPEPGENP